MTEHMESNNLYNQESTYLGAGGSSLSQLLHYYGKILKSVEIERERVLFSTHF